MNRTAPLSLLLLVLLACGPDDSLSTPPARPPQPLTPSGSKAFSVTGTVVDSNANPVPGVAVVVAGKAPVNTDASGQFTFTEVTTPYDVTLVDAATKTAVVYKGLRRADPQLLHVGADLGGTYWASMSGFVKSTVVPKPADRHGIIAFSSPELTVSSWVYDDGSFELTGADLQWTGKPTTEGRIVAIEAKFDAQFEMPIEFTGFASRSRALMSGASFDESFGLLAITGRSLSGTVSPPPNYALDRKGYGLMFDGRTSIRFAEQNPSSGFLYVTPAAPDLKISLHATAVREGRGTVVGFKNGLAPDAVDVRLVLPAPSEAILPADAATAIDSSIRFSWTKFQGGVHVATFGSLTPGAPAFYVVTDEDSATLPDLAAYGMGLPARTSYAWRVDSVAPVANVDAAAADAFRVFRDLHAASETFYGFSNTRTFETR